MRFIARLFSHTRQIEEELDHLVELHSNTEERRHAEFDALRQDIVRVSERAAAAESRVGLLQAEIERLERWNDKLSDQNFALTDRLCLKAGTVPTSEPLSAPKLSDEELDSRSARIDSVRRTGPVAKLRERAALQYESHRDHEQQLLDRATAAHNAQQSKA